MIDEEEWMVEPIATNLYPFLPLTGEKGSVVIMFLGPPRKNVSNFKDEEGNVKTEWHFDVRHIDTETKRWEMKTISESSKNFRSKVTEMIRNGGWEQTMKVSWEKIKPAKGRKFKSFTFEPIELSDLVVDEA